MRKPPPKPAMPTAANSAENSDNRPGQHAQEQENAALRQKLLEIIKRKESLRQAKSH